MQETSNILQYFAILYLIEIMYSYLQFCFYKNLILAKIFEFVPTNVAGHFTSPYEDTEVQRPTKLDPEIQQTTAIYIKIYIRVVPTGNKT